MITLQLHLLRLLSSLEKGAPGRCRVPRTREPECLVIGRTVERQVKDEVLKAGLV